MGGTGNYTFRLPANLEIEIERIAQAERRIRADIAKFMVERGLVAYKRDGLLFEPPPPPDLGKKKKPTSEVG